MGGQVATIKDVAKASGLSVATVSRAINNSTSISKHTYDSVMRAINDLNYQPNLLGRNLRRTETRMVLVLLPTISNPFYARIVKGIEDIAHKNGYNIMLCNTDSDKQREKIYLNLLRSRLSDGVIFMEPELDKEEITKIGESFPVVQCCEYKEGSGVSHVSINNFAAAYDAVKHLISLGHNKIGLISSSNRFISTIQRENAYIKALKDSGLSFSKSMIKYGDYGFKSGLLATKQFLENKEKPTAIFAISDIMAIGAIKAVKEAKMKVPNDVAIMGFDDVSFASMCDPLLTTISQPQYDLGCVAMQLLLKCIKGEMKKPEYIFLEHELIIRESTINHL